MSDLFTDSASDISSFATWERQNNESLPTERERSMADLADDDRVWKGPDSSNDARSSDEEEAVGVRDETVFVNAVDIKEKKAKGGKGKRKERKMEISSSTADEESQSQRRVVEEMEGIEVRFCQLS